MSKPRYQQPPSLPNNRIAVDFDAFFKPTWKQRFQLLIGYTIVINSKCFIDRKNESVRAGTTLRLSEKLTAEEQAKENHAV
jgi:hypothetical protein